jgi:hypothetical protein
MCHLVSPYILFVVLLILISNDLYWNSMVGNHYPHHSCLAASWAFLNILVWIMHLLSLGFHSSNYSIADITYILCSYLIYWAYLGTGILFRYFIYSLGTFLLSCLAYIFPMTDRQTDRHRNIKIIQIYQDKDGNKMDRHTYLFSPSVCFSLQLLVSTSWNCCLWIHSSFSYSPIAYKSYSHLVSVSYILIR